MARMQEPPPGQLIVSIIYNSLDALADALNALEKRFGRVQYETVEIECALAKSYSEEMGDTLQRRFFSFDRLVSRATLPEAKSACSKIEARFSDRVDDFCFRTVNIDPGIMCPSNLIMASHREYNHRVYLRDAVYVEIALIYSQGRFNRLPWTVPDFYDDEAIDFFERVRASFDMVQSEPDSSLVSHSGHPTGR